MPNLGGRFGGNVWRFYAARLRVAINAAHAPDRHAARRQRSETIQVPPRAQANDRPLCDAQANDRPLCDAGARTVGRRCPAWPPCGSAREISIKRMVSALLMLKLQCRWCDEWRTAHIAYRLHQPVRLHASASPQP